jgi:hypothetical protein
MGGAILFAVLAAVAPPCPARPAEQGQVRSSFVGDVDGDGAPDRAFVRVDAHAAPRCALHLVVRLRRGPALVARLAPPFLDAEAIRQHPWPRVAGLAEIDSRPGAEIVATVDEGASTVFLAVFTVQRHRLRRMRLPTLEQAFPALGSVMNFAGVDCVGSRRSGVVVSTLAGRNLKRLSVERRFFRAVGTHFSLIRRKTYSFGANATPRFPELSGRGPFARCLVGRRA